MATSTFHSILARAGLLLAAACSGAPATPKTIPSIQETEALPWIHDDYPAALAKAKERSVPIVIDAWAPWCHTCLAMKHGVLADASLAALSDRFVWLAIDTDREENAAALAKFSVDAWPTFYVVSSIDEAVQARLQGAVAPSQFREFLLQGERGHLDTAAAGGAIVQKDPLWFVREGDRRAAAKESDAAEKAYAAALAAAPLDWPRRPEILVARIAALADGQRWSDCVDLALEEMDRTGSSASAADFVGWGASCINMLPSDEPRRLRFLERGSARLQVLADNAKAALSLDDRSETLRMLREILIAAGRDDEARAAAKRQMESLERAIRQAPSPTAAATYNWPLAEVSVFLGRGAEAIPILEASQDALPNDYDPPYRIAWIALQIGDLEEARAQANRALSLAYGPRQGKVLLLLAEIHRARGDESGRRETLGKALALYESLPQGQAQPEAVASIRQDLAGAASSSPR